MMRSVPILIFVSLAVFISITYTQFPITGLTATQALAAALGGVAAAVAGGAGLAALLAAAANAGGGGTVQQPANNYGNNNYGGYPHGRSFNKYNYATSGNGYTTAESNFADYPQEFGYNYAKPQQQQYRQKRDLSQVSIEELALMDEYDCGKQYLCEITAMMASANDIHDELILDLIQTDLAIGEELKDFRTASLFGLKTKDPYQCNGRYKRCATGKQSMVSIVQFIQEQQEYAVHPNNI